MILITNKKCVICNKKKPSFGLEGKQSTHCSDCRTNIMTDTKHKKCIKCNVKRASFGLDGESPDYCVDCRNINMININIKKCIKCNVKSPSFGIEGDKMTHCGDCKTSEMINIKHAKCKTEKCNTQANLKYDGHCAYCYGNLFPDCPLVRNFKTKERLVVDFIREEYPDYTWKFDTIIENACSRRRPDIYLDLGFQVIIIEVDEDQHKKYENICENKRLMELSQDIGHRPMVFIRFNPDKYLDENDKNVPSCFSITQKTGALKVNNNKKWNERLNTLKNKVDYWVNNETEKTVELVPLYYDKN
jgi:hypothetical protein